MAQTKVRIRSLVFIVAALFLGLLSAFFIFYAARLFYVTHGLRAIRAGGQGAYIGAIAFPALAVLLGFGAWRCVGAARRASQHIEPDRELAEPSS